MAEPQPDIAPQLDPVRIEPLWEPTDGLAEDRITYDKLCDDSEIIQLIEAADAYLDVIGYTDHGMSHLSRVSRRAYCLLKELDIDQRECELAAIAGLLHDIGNVVHRNGHPYHSALMCFQLLKERAMATREIALLINAIANHDEESGEPVSNVASALVIADKSDVLRSRVRNPKMISFDIHDRVNYAATKSEVTVDKASHLITLNLEIDTKISHVMEYFEIFISRMRMCRRSANFLNCDFQLVINQVQVM